MKFVHFLLITAALATCLSSCKKLNSYQKTHSIEHASWDFDTPVAFSFDIDDTASEYEHYLILRINDNYDYSNIWLKISVKEPGDTAYTSVFKSEFILAEKTGQWLGEQQGTLWNFKLPVSSRRLLFDKAGTYSIQVQQVMRDDHLNAVMNVGWAIERKTD